MHVFQPDQGLENPPQVIVQLHQRVRHLLFADVLLQIDDLQVDEVDERAHEAAVTLVRDGAVGVHVIVPDYTPEFLHQFDVAQRVQHKVFEDELVNKTFG